MTWPKRLQVDKRIVSLLSASTYESFPKALREAVSNAYDADATRVDITIDLDGGAVTILDNGRGMTADEFDFFLRIAGKTSATTRSRLGRSRIGQFGIGFLAVFPFCEMLEVESTTAGSPATFFAHIPAARFTDNGGPAQEVNETEVTGYETQDEAIRPRHFTRLTLRGITYLARRYFDPRPAQTSRESQSIASWTALERLRWQMGETLPVRYAPESPIAAALGTIGGADFTVILNGIELRRNDYCAEILDDGRDKEVGGVTFSYAIGTPWRAVHPYEGQGLKMRLRGVGVGERTIFDLHVHGRTFSRMHWLSGDIYILAGLEDSISLDRESFTTTASFDEFRNFFRSHLRALAYQIEEIDVAKRKLTTLSAQQPPPDADVIREHINTLVRHGFVEQAGKPTSGPSGVMVDIPKRTVTVSPGLPSPPADTMSLAGRDFAVRHSTWSPAASSRYPACRLNGNTLEFNEDYPPFRGPYGDVLRRVHAALIVGERVAIDTGIDLFNAIQQELAGAFERRAQ
jgi:hypothetical protein